MTTPHPNPDPKKQRASLPASSDPLELLRRRAKRISPDEIAEANLLLYQQLGLDLDDVGRMAEVVGLEAIDLLLLSRHVSVTVSDEPKPSRVGTPGRKRTHEDIADFAHSRWEQEMTWRQIYNEWRSKFPNDERVKSPETIREAHRRYYGDKARKGY